MYSFKNDYSEGCHPRILEALTRTNLEQTVGYGCDEHCTAAADAIRRVIGCPTAQVHFISGGTQTNLLAVAACLRPYEGVIAASAGHIAGHESGAIEATGHKVLTIPAPESKLTPTLIRQVYDAHREEYCPQPGMVYLSDATEWGAVYSKAELTALSQCCRELGLYLFLDGARIAQALAVSDLTLADVAALTDAFYIGGTKNGALFGEALVLVHPALQPHFRTLLKQRGGMLAKGRMLGIQFEELFRDDLYFQLGRQAVERAVRLQDGLRALGYPMYVDSPTNQIFPIVTPEQLKRFSERCLFEVMEALPDGRTVIRLCTSWATPEHAVEELLQSL